MKKLYVATHNKHKIREISQILPDFEIIPDNPEGVEETAADFEGNALIKVRAIALRHPGQWCMADDSGLEVDALNGAPGVRSARYAGGDGDTAANNALLLKNLEGIENRKANFTCAIALVDPLGSEHIANGKVFGTIAKNLSGSEGFGYDPLFIPEGYDESFADISADEKNAISHRARALAQVRKIINPSTSGGVKSWFKLLRVVNLPTVPGDVLLGAMASVVALGGAYFAPASIAAAAVASVFIYIFGLLDNDIVGAKTNIDRPIPNGEISLISARLARFFALSLTLVIGYVCKLSPVWWVAVSSLLVAIILYNRTKLCVLMGACRALNILCGVAVLLPDYSSGNVFLFTLAGVLSTIWLTYIAVLTHYASDENICPYKRATVALMIGAIVYLQLLAMVVFLLMFPNAIYARQLLVVGAVLLFCLRFFKTFFSKVSAT